MAAAPRRGRRGGYDPDRVRRVDADVSNALQAKRAVSEAIDRLGRVADTAEAREQRLHVDFDLATRPASAANMIDVLLSPAADGLYGSVVRCSA